MDVILLAGGKGTRLHPLTQDIPKPMVPVVNRPWLHHLAEVIEALPVSGIRCAVHYRWEAIRDMYRSWFKGHIPVKLVLEREALGTGGAIRNAAAGIADTFMVLNADVVPGMDLRDLIRFHKENKADCTIALTRVEDPSAYGVVELSSESRIMRFVEKPAPDEAPSNLINAGVYVMEPNVLDYIPGDRPVSVEREIFPELIRRGLRVYGFTSGFYWNDIGTRNGYLTTHWDILDGRMPVRLPDAQYLHDPGENIRICHKAHVEPGVRLIGPVFIGEGCTIRSGATIGPRVVLGPHVRVGRGSIIRDSVIWAGAQIGSNAFMEECIVGFNTVIEDSRKAKAELIRGRCAWESATRPVTASS
ncbi:MAG TPA: NDP-sugar synthase [Firmicutes bacterium]|nr:NDP-sugar synthase [Bacillota bacterium]